MPAYNKDMCNQGVPQYNLGDVKPKIAYGQTSRTIGCGYQS